MAQLVRNPFRHIFVPLVALAIVGASQLGTAKADGISITDPTTGASLPTGSTFVAKGTTSASGFLQLKVTLEYGYQDTSGIQHVISTTPPQTNYSQPWAGAFSVTRNTTLEATPGSYYLIAHVVAYYPNGKTSEGYAQVMLNTPHP